MKSFKALERDFKRKVTELQASCKHEDISPWTELYWAPGHKSFCKIRVCKICNKEIERRSDLPAINDFPGFDQPDKE